MYNYQASEESLLHERLRDTNKHKIPDYSEIRSLFKSYQLKYQRIEDITQEAIME